MYVICVFFPACLPVSCAFVSGCVLYTETSSAYLFNLISVFVHTSIPTHEPVSSFNIYLVKLLSVPNVVWFLVLKNKPEDIWSCETVISWNTREYPTAMLRKSYWFSLQPHVNEVPLVFAVPLSRVRGRVLRVWGAFWCHVHSPSSQNHLKRTPERNGIITNVQQNNTEEFHCPVFYKTADLLHSPHISCANDYHTTLPVSIYVCVGVCVYTSCTVL